MENRTHVQVRYLGPTNHRGARTKISGYFGQLVEPRDYETDHLRQGEQMAKEYAIKYDISYTKLISTQLQNGDHIIIFV